VDGILGHNLLLSQAFFHNFIYQEAFLTNFFFFYDGILAVTKPFSQSFSFFTMEFWLSRSLSHNLFLFSRWNSGYTQFGGRLFYTYIIKSIYKGFASLKTLPLDLEPPLQGKEYDPPYSNTTKK
jgi:hypothetical protein